MAANEENHPRTTAFYRHGSPQNLGYDQDYEPGANFDLGAKWAFVWVCGSEYSCASAFKREV